jgi:hypothetical protein
MRWLAVLVCSILLAVAGTALADCEYEGETYPEGTRIGPYVCVDGQWVPD